MDSMKFTIRARKNVEPTDSTGVAGHGGLPSILSAGNLNALPNSLLLGLGPGGHKLPRHAKKISQGVVVNPRHAHKDAWVVHVMISDVVNVWGRRDQHRTLIKPDLYHQ